MPYLECDRLNELVAASLQAYHAQRVINRSTARYRTLAAKQEESALMRKSLVAAARFRLHQASDHPELGLKSTLEDLDLVYGDDN
jgi:hypothetical protein